MKRPIALLASLLAVTVLATAAMAAGGDSSDPLISLNYLQTTFTTKATSSIDAALDKSDQAAYAKAEAALRSTIAAAEANVGAQRADVFTESRLKQGDILSGTTGLQVIVLAGSVNVQFSSGAVVDVTTGSEVKSGAALAENHRYLVAEDTTALFTVTGKTAVVNYCGFYSIASSSSVGRMNMLVTKCACHATSMTKRMAMRVSLLAPQNASTTYRRLLDSSF